MIHHGNSHLGGGARAAVAASFLFGCVGCGSDPAPTYEPAASGGGAPECTDEPVETRLPGVHASDEVLVLCRACDHGCELEPGEPCDAHGTSCDFFGVTGVCIACCDGERGELRCSDID